MVVADLVHLGNQGKDGSLHALVHEEGNALEHAVSKLFGKRGFTVGQVGQQGEPRHGTLVILSSSAPGTVLVLLLLEPAEGLDDGFLALRGASVLRDALHAVVQIAAFGKSNVVRLVSAGALSVVKADIVPEFQAFGKGIGGNFHVNFRIVDRDVRSGGGDDDSYFRFLVGAAGTLWPGYFRFDGVLASSFLHRVHGDGRFFRNGGDDIHQIEQEPHQGNAEKGDGDGGSQGFGALPF